MNNLVLLTIWYRLWAETRSTGRLAETGSTGRLTETRSTGRLAKTGGTGRLAETRSTGRFTLTRIRSTPGSRGCWVWWRWRTPTGSRSSSPRGWWSPTGSAIGDGGIPSGASKESEPGRDPPSRSGIQTSTGLTGTSQVKNGLFGKTGELF